jgi:inner membrane protein
MAARRFPLIGKALALAGVLIALSAALQTVGGIVAEREGRLREAERGVAASLASAQTLVGPLLQRDCLETWDTVQGEGKDRKTVTERHRHRLSATPATLEVKADAVLEPRYRGIFKVNGYVLKANIVAAWRDGLGLQPQVQHAGSRMQCEAPVMVVALGDSRGVRSATVQIDGTPAPALPGTLHPAHPRGFHADVAESFAGAKRPLRAEVGLELVGTGDLAFAPVGDSTRVELASDWPHPSFAGRFLPVERQVRESGFSARWQLNALATTAPQAARDGGRACALGDASAEATNAEEARRSRCIETFGVAFIDPVSPYVLADRATKYGLLFIALTFVGVGIVEVMRRLRVHPIQYLLVGAALATFFLLLVSLSEHVSFAAAYLAAACACTLLLTFYGSFVLRGARAGAAFGAGVAALYAALYALLQLEQTALLIGSTLLFVVLAALMVVTRRIDWYALLARMRAESGGAPVPAGSAAAPPA